MSKTQRNGAAADLTSTGHSLLDTGQLSSDPGEAVLVASGSASKTLGPLRRLVLSLGQ